MRSTLQAFSASATWSSLWAPRRGRSEKPGVLWTAPFAVLGVCALSWLVLRFDAPLVLSGLIAVGAAVVMLVRPEWATLLVVFLLYTNIPVLATRQGISVAAASSFMLLLGFPLVHYGIVRRERLKADTPFFLMLVLLGVLLISALGAKGPAVAEEYIWTYVLEGLVLYWLLINSIRSRATLMRVIWTLLAAGALLGGLTAYQELTGSYDQQFGGLTQRNYEYMQLQKLDQNDPEVRELLQNFSGGRNPRAKGPMSEPNRFAQVLLVLIPLALFAYRAARSRWSRMCALAAAVLILGGIVFTDSRGAFATLLVLALLAGYLRWIRRSHLLVGVLALALAVPIIAPRYVERVLSIANVTALTQGPTASAAADGAIRGRATQMLAAAQVVLDYPLLGVGPGQYAPYYAMEYQSKDPRLKFRDISYGRRAHSLYLEMSAELGIVGISVFFAIFAVLLRALNHARLQWRDSQPLLADLATAFAFSLLAFLGTSTFLHLSFQRYHWLLVALASAALAIIHSADRSDERTLARSTGSVRAHSLSAEEQ